MKSNDLKYILLQFVEDNQKKEIIEFKEAKSSFDFTKLGRYFSALSNEANLKGTDSAWIVFGVEDMSHKIVGTNFRNNDKLHSLKKEIV
ncbi:MAG: ATP-binding protein [Candidatus Delongbacteria bacterium]|nr:ATP-binding protein [Candidatus Delongbacteria bacterium]MCG2760168.1 ATP-binding protein [Candidatus Delongbacteria bacterium]